MRAIDADALINRIVFHTDWPTDEKEAFKDEVNAEPTVTPERETGKWLVDGHHIRCNKCGEYMCRKDCEGEVIPRNFCPNCGVPMEGLYEIDRC